MRLLACGSIHQGHGRFSSQSQGKQCSFMSLSALLAAQTVSFLHWNSKTIHNVLVQGGSLYLTAFENGDIPPEGFLLVNELPTVVRCGGCRQVKQLVHCYWGWAIINNIWISKNNQTNTKWGLISGFGCDIRFNIVSKANSHSERGP